MKRFLLPLGLVAALTVSCVGFPPPAPGTDSLAIGTFSMSFPGGFFGGPPETITSRVELDFRDTSTGTWFPVFTQPDGHFWFVARGSDQYILEGSRTRVQGPTAEYVLGERELNVEIPAANGKILYLGDLALTYKPEKLYPSASDTFPITTTYQKDYELQPPARSNTDPPVYILQSYYQYWAYSTALSQRWSEDSLRTYMKQRDPAGQWSGKEIVKAPIKPKES